MSVQTKKTNNSFLQDKIDLRIENLPEKEKINVLDLFTGETIIWNKIKKTTKKDINVIGIDKKEYNNIYLKGDNLKFLPSLNLNSYDIIDLDSYGVPFLQLDFILNNTKGKIIFITFIQTMFGALPNKLLFFLGFNKRMIKLCPSLFNRNGFEKIKNYLSKKSVKKIQYKCYNNKYYICCKN